MSREPYTAAANSGSRSPTTGQIRSAPASRRITELPTVDRSPSRDYATRGSPSGKQIKHLNFFCFLKQKKNQSNSFLFRFI